MRLPAPSYMVETVLGAAVVVLGVVTAWPDPPRRPRPAPPADPAPPIRTAPPPFTPPAESEESRRARDAAHALAVKDWRETVAAEKHRLKHDPVRTADVRAAYLMAARASSVGAFERTPGKDAPWADVARKVLETRARLIAEQQLSAIPSEAVVQADRAALAAAAQTPGLDDPLVRYWALRSAGQDHRPPDLPGFRAAVDALCDSGYPAVRRAHAAFNWLVAAGTLPPGHDLRADEAERLDRFWELFEAAARARDRATDEELIEIAERYEAYRMGPGRPRVAALDELDRHLRRAGARDYLRLTVRGAGLVRAAWDARGAGFADTVPEEGWRVFTACLQDARDALVGAADADPDGFTAPTAMLSVCMGLGLDREEMEYTFRQAMAANPDNLRACVQKLEILHPKWSGSRDGHEYLTFAWALALHPGDGPVRDAAIRSLVANTPVAGPRFEASRPAVAAYYANPDVLALVREAAERTLAARPDDAYTLNLYARVMAVAGAHAEARPLFARIGDDFSPRVFADRNDYDRFRREVGLIP